MITYNFSSPFDLINQTERVYESGYPGSGDLTRRLFNNTVDQEFYGAASWEDAKKLFKSYTPKCDDMRILTGTHQNNFLTELTPSCSGFFNDIGAYMTGEPECMADFSYHETTRFKEIYIDTSLSSKNELTDIEAYTAEALRAVVDLERNNTRCSIYITSGATEVNNKTKGGGIYTVTKIKDHSEPLNGSLHGFCLGSAVFMRVFILAFTSMQLKNTRCGYPHPYPGSIAYKNHSPNEIYNLIIK